MRLLSLPKFVATLLVCATLPVHAEPTARYNQVNLTAQAQRDVAHDVMRVSLYAEAQDSDPVRLAAQITRLVNDATGRARAAAGVTVQTGSRANFPVHDKNGQRIVGWRERAELHLESRDFTALAELTAELTETLQIASRQFIISPASRKQHEDALIEEAIVAFRARAQLAAQAFGGAGYRLVSVSLDSGGFRPVMVERRAVAMASLSSRAEAQQIEAGTSVVSVTASGLVEIRME